MRNTQGFPPDPYLYKCGVLDVICLLPGSTTTFYKSSEISSTLSFITTMYNHQRSGVELEEQMYNMLTLVYKGGEFSFEGNLPAVLNDAIVDIDIIIHDDIPQSQQNALMNRACDYVNQLYGTSYQAFPGSRCSTESRNISCINMFNLRLKK